MKTIQTELKFKAWNSEKPGQFFDDGFGFILDGAGEENYPAIQTAIEELLDTADLTAIGRLIGHRLEIFYFDN